MLEKNFKTHPTILFEQFLFQTSHLRIHSLNICANNDAVHNSWRDNVIILSGDTLNFLQNNLISHLPYDNFDRTRILHARIYIVYVIAVFLWITHAFPSLMANYTMKRTKIIRIHFDVNY